MSLMVAIAEGRNRMDPSSEGERRFREAVVMAWERGYEPEEIVAFCSAGERPAFPVGRILSILKEEVDEAI